MFTANDLQLARDFLGESQAKFASRFGVDQSTLHRWETDGPPKRGAAQLAINSVLRDLGMKPRRRRRVEA